MSAECPRYTPKMTANTAFHGRNSQGTAAVFCGVLFPPKAEVTGSNPVGCANDFNRLY